MNADVIRVFILERSPRMMIKLLSFFESKLDVEVVEANQNVDAFLDEARRFEMKGLMDKLRPEVILVDLCEPVKNDLVILAKIKEMAFVPVIAFSTLELPRRDVSEMGFYSLVRRPSLDDEQDERTAFNKLLYHIRNASFFNDQSLKKAGQARKTLTSPPAAAPAPGAVRLIAIGASTGGTEALIKLVSAFPENMPCIAIVQHITRGFSGIFAEHLARRSLLRARVAFDGAPLCPNVIYVAADDTHLTVERCGAQFVFRCLPGEKVSGHRPSVDVLFNSVAGQVGRAAIGVILTGMGKDGAEGLLAMRRAGAFTIGQDEASSLIYGMPKVAFNLGAVEKQLPLNSIAAGIVGKIRNEKQ